MSAVVSLRIFSLLEIGPGSIIAFSSTLVTDANCLGLENGSREACLSWRTHFSI